MKIYFGASIAGKEYFEKNYLAIISELEALGHEVFCDYFLKASVKSINNQTEEESINAQLGFLKGKLNSDILVFEVSFRSFGIGQEIANAFRLGKPVLALYLKNNKPHILRNEAGDSLLVVEYNLSNLKQILKENLQYFKIGENRRFTLLLPAHQTNYLDEVLRKTGISRSEYIRKLIDSDIKKE